MNLNKQQALDANSKAIQQINFTGNPELLEIHQCSSLLKQSKKLSWISQERNSKNIGNSFCKFIWY